MTALRTSPSTHSTPLAEAPDRTTVDPRDRSRRALLREDAAVTAALGLVGLLAPSAWWGGAPSWLAPALGAAFLVAAVDVALVSRWTGRRLRLATLVTGELALGVALAGAAVLLLAGLPAAGAVVVGVTTAASAAFGVAELRLAREG